MTNTVPAMGPTELANLLAEMNAKGCFPISVITDSQGLTIASAADSEEDPNTQSAVVALIQKTATQAGDQIGLAQTAEIILNDQQGRRLICRPFQAGDQDMILTVIVPQRQQTYRRLTNQVVHAVQRQWK
ncbi:MAG: hypothetical protein AAF629_22000 [Chloroflexota bacterium]